jgi:biotin operon repressor
MIISQVAKKLGVSRQAVYEKIKKLDLSQHLSDSDKGKQLSEEGIEILKESFGQTINSKPIQTLTGIVTQDNQSSAEHLERIIDSQEKQIEFLTRQIEFKDEELMKLYTLIKQTQDLLLKQQEGLNKNKGVLSFWRK